MGPGPLLHCAAMARKKPRPSRRPQADEAKLSSSQPGPQSDPAPPRRRRDVRGYLYAGFDLALVVLWAALLSTVLANRHGWAAALLWSLVGFGVVMGAGMMIRNRWGWRAAAAGCVGVLLVWLIVVVALLLSASYLAGVYGAFGRAAAMGTLVVGVLSLQLVALIPALQLKFLMTRSGRRHFGQEPL